MKFNYNMGMEVRLNNLNSIILIVYFSYFQIQGTYSSQYSIPQYNYYNSVYSKFYPNHLAYYKTGNHPSSTKTSPELKTEYGFETVQQGSAYVNPYGKNYVPVRVAPDKDQTKYNFVRINTATHYLPIDRTPQLQNSQQPNALTSSKIPNRNQTTVTQSRQQSRRHHRRHYHRSNVNDGECVKCPSEKVIIAQKGLDGVLIDPPKLKSCHNRLILNGEYYIETLFGREFKFLLPHGSHSFHAKIRSTRNLKFGQSCMLRYKVIVQQCGRFYPQDENLRVKCDPGYIWGSKCYFTCRTGYLSHNEPMMCGDNLKWEGDEPECLTDSSYTNKQSSKSCDFIEVPENGKFSCQYPTNVNGDDYDNELVTPEGTICRVTCNRNYEIPLNLLSYSTLRCENGRWNSTAQGLCRPKFRHRY